jgi:hypothetical protein
MNHERKFYPLLLCYSIDVIAFVAELVYHIVTSRVTDSHLLKVQRGGAACVVADPSWSQSFTSCTLLEVLKCLKVKIFSNLTVYPQTKL